MENLPEGDRRLPYWDPPEGFDTEATRVCLTHERLNICRQGMREGGCVWSEDEDDIRRIGKAASGEYQGRHCK